MPTRRMQQARLAASRSLVRAFTLIEVLLAVFILGVGVISIAALFPAGIVQQRLSVDDVMGAMAANNALTILRTKLKQEDFGFLNLPGGHPTIQGDFAWSRPAFYFGSNSNSPPWERGINIFQNAGSNTEVPYSTAKYPAGPPNIFISQGERYYPMCPLKDVSAPAAGFLNEDLSRPQYLWECMFRRFEGKVLVAIFVYRVSAPGGGTVSYGVGPNPSVITVPPVPIARDLPQPWNADNGTLPNCGSFANPIRGGNGPFNPDNDADAWKEQRQWILDQNNNLHRVLAQSHVDDNPANLLQIELVRPVPAMPALKAYFLPGGSVNGVVTKIWYMPLKMDMNNDGAFDVNITPVYATVKEL